MRGKRTQPFLFIVAAAVATSLSCSSPDFITSDDDPTDDDPTDDVPTPIFPLPDPDSIPSGFRLALQDVVSGLEAPVALVSPPGRNTLIILEKPGRVRVVENEQLLPTPFLNIESVVQNSGEQGLLGIAFHPNYSANGWFYLFYTGTDQATHIVRYVRSADDPNVADPNSAHEIMNIAPHASNHNGGNMAFAPDGMLLIGLGDGGGGAHGDRTSLLGSLLRINVNQDPYAIPFDNPYIGHPSFKGEIWAFALRNPWRWSIDRQTSLLYIGDVGAHSAEEVDVVHLGTLNYGWSIMEGRECHVVLSCDREGLAIPVLDYGRSDGCSVIGGFVYRGRAIPEIRGRYFYSDWCQGWLRSFRHLSGAATEQREWDVGAFGQPLSFGEDSQGELYLLSHLGSVLRIVKGN